VFLEDDWKKTSCEKIARRQKQALEELPRVEISTLWANNIQNNPDYWTDTMINTSEMTSERGEVC